MNELIPIFPLEMVVFPGEALNLHIFEPRYRQLIADCEAEGIRFGIPAIVDKAMPGCGTLIELEEITQRYDDGRLDIKTRGLKVFTIQKLMKQMPGKFYSGAGVEFADQDMTAEAELLRQVLASVKLLHSLLKVEKKFPPANKLTSYDLGHHVGLSLPGEYELLQLRTELARLEFLNRHLEKILPTVAEMEKLKERIQLNGHFKKLPGFEL
ncbi:MAG: LON peptidase substrate-binding domain-containing protein [Verrucomicrobiota bacterium]